jgi:hypothetical protein
MLLSWRLYHHNSDQVLDWGQLRLVVAADVVPAAAGCCFCCGSVTRQLLLLLLPQQRLLLLLLLPLCRMHAVLYTSAECKLSCHHIAVCDSLLQG